MIRKIEPLRKGDKIGIIAPSAIFDRQKFKAGVAFIREMGLIPELGPSLFKKDFIFAGTLEERLQSFRKMAARRDLKALWCVRGGYGAYELAEVLAKEKAHWAPKVVLGMSDITALHLLMMQKWGWPALHAPLLDRIGQDKVPAGEKRVLRETLLNPGFRLKWASGLKSFGAKDRVAGEVVGGNLSLLVSSLGTRWEVETRGKIVFMEDIGERAYRLDRMLFQLEAAGKFRNVRALVFGDFTECAEPDGRELWHTVIKRRFSKAPYPVLTGIPSGHGDLRLTIPFGIRAKVENHSQGAFEVLEGVWRER